MSRTKLARAALVAVLILMLAVTPLSAILTGTHETWLPGYGVRPRVRVVLLDQTGLVQGISSAADRAQSAQSRLVVSWYGCGHSTLTFDRADGGFLLTEHEVLPCGFFGNWRSLLIHFWSPIDPSSVAVDLPQ